MFFFVFFLCVVCCFFFNDTATTEIYTLSLHDALPISDYVGLNDTEETALVDVMVCACKQATLGQGPPGRVHKKVHFKDLMNEMRFDNVWA